MILLTNGIVPSSLRFVQRHLTSPRSWRSLLHAAGCRVLTVHKCALVVTLWLAILPMLLGILIDLVASPLHAPLLTAQALQSAGGDQAPPPRLHDLTAAARNLEQVRTSVPLAKGRGYSRWYAIGHG